LVQGIFEIEGCDKQTSFFKEQKMTEYTPDRIAPQSSGIVVRCDKCKKPARDEPTQLSHDGKLKTFPTGRMPGVARPGRPPATLCVECWVELMDQQDAAVPYPWHPQSTKGKIARKEAARAFWSLRRCMYAIAKRICKEWRKGHSQ